MTRTDKIWKIAEWLGWEIADGINIYTPWGCVVLWECIALPPDENPFNLLFFAEAAFARKGWYIQPCGVGGLRLSKGLNCQWFQANINGNSRQYEYDPTNPDSKIDAMLDAMVEVCEIEEEA